MNQLELSEHFGIAPEALHLIPELLQDLWELGSDPQRVSRWLGEEGVGPGSAVLDLGCGKGAVSLTAANDLGCRVDGVDAFEPFIIEARAHARRLGVESRCRLEVGDLRDALDRGGTYDAVLLVSVGLLGSAEQTIGACRQVVRPGGLIVLEDAYARASEQIDFPGYRDLGTREAHLRGLIAHGDELIRERRTPLAELEEQNQRYNTWIGQRAEELVRRHPQHAAAVRAYVEKEQQECAILETQVECALWMLRKR